MGGAECGDINMDNLLELGLNMDAGSHDTHVLMNIRCSPHNLHNTKHTYTRGRKLANTLSMLAISFCCHTSDFKDNDIKIKWFESFFFSIIIYNVSDHMSSAISILAYK